MFTVNVNFSYQKELEKITYRKQKHTKIKLFQIKCIKKKNEIDN